MALRTRVLPMEPPFLTKRLDHLAKGQHTDQIAMFHDDQGTDVFVAIRSSARDKGSSGWAV
jgi:hypothetical protein